MNLLVLSDKPLARRYGDALRLAGLLQPQRGRVSADLLCFARPGEAMDAECAALFRHVWTLPWPGDPPARPWLARAARSLRVSEFKVSSAAMRARVAELDASGRYALLLDLSGNMLLNLPARLATPLVIDAIDEPLLRERRALLRAQPGDWPRLLHRALMFWRYERALFPRAALVTYAAEPDAVTFARLCPRTRAAVLPNGVDARHYFPQAARVNTREIVFEGNLSFGPNVDAARWLCNSILPRLKRRQPDARVLLVGRDPAPAVRALAGPDVIVTGTVPDVRPYLARAAVFVCPMRLGSGIKNKILQAWAMGRPVVATRASLGGLAARDDENLLVRDEPDAFAAAIDTVMRDRALALRLGQAGRATVVAHYTWERQAQRWFSLLDAVARPAAAPDADVLPARPAAGSPV